MRIPISSLFAVHSSFDSSLNPALPEYAERSQAKFNEEMASSWSQRRRDFSRGVSGMNAMWNNGEKNVILATAKPAKMLNIQDLIDRLSQKYNQDPRLMNSKSPKD
ncbi:Oidioi.mRNA.OKI2018_I69.PAR.g10107.t1.cds [Oikopleura dioica]|uniref:Oidioi.mRNA.OKI2018_I69.PAR.g10107.t1.cds n=1 Tax=Oikopleura dioica TaxID=34765 RepID=A0ABN7RNW7_OIKDI|nr:Oidioi.mRNA.OKI2018_I69.PAR.g10107.t1.cds [Oikopleura dioica]